MSQLDQYRESLWKQNISDIIKKDQGGKLWNPLNNKNIDAFQSNFDPKLESKTIDQSLLLNNIPSDFKHIEVIEKDKNADFLRKHRRNFKKHHDGVDLGSIIIRNKLNNQRLSSLLQEWENKEFNRYKHKNRFEPEFKL